MTDRLYYRDASLRTFDARVVKSEEREPGKFMSVLDRTAFYPSSGGQPFDTGQLAGAPVVEVVDEDDDVVHVTESALEVGADVRGEIDWARRFDHMQQHTGQHVLSAAFERAVGARTLSFHLGSAAATIDLARETTPSEIAAAEELANAVVWDDRPVGIRFVDAESAQNLPLRKESDRVGTLRLVEIPEFDLSACGGTHVSRTGAIGLIAITGWERFKSGSRITFRCGGRALQSYRALRDTVLEAGRVLSVGAGELSAAAKRSVSELRAGERRIAELSQELLRYRAAGWRASAETIGHLRGVLRADGSLDGTAIKSAAQAVVAGENGLIVVLVGGGDPAPVVVARSADVSFDAGALVKALVGVLGGRGGGRPELAQGGIASDAERVLVTARQLIVSG